MKYLSNFLFPFNINGSLDVINKKRIHSLLGSVKIQKHCVDEYMRQKVKLFRKIPQHVVFIIGGEKPSYKDFVKIISWCLLSGISHISFYDHHNGIDCHTFFNYVCKYATPYISSIKWGKSFTEDIKEKSRSHINGYSWMPRVTVHVCREEDGLDAMLYCLRKTVQFSDESGVSGAFHQSDEKLSKLSIKGSEMNSATARSLPTILCKAFSAPDPDVAVVTGPVLCSYGFPPWQLRVTEFLHIPTHQKITSSTFLYLLQKFSNCEQRFGN